jgi:hypothetical protein
MVDRRSAMRVENGGGIAALATLPARRSLPSRTLAAGFSRAAHHMKTSAASPLRGAALFHSAAFCSRRFT